jgi:alpha-soluble NSF attachment protein
LFDLYLETGNYPLAAKTLERYVAANENKMMVLKNQESIFNSALCRLAYEPSSDVEIFLNKYFDEGLISGTDRRYQFLLAVIGTVQEGDEDSFTEAVRNFDSTSRLKPWQIKILLLAKEKYFTQLDPDLC